MVTIEISYQGQKHCELKHRPSGTTIATDAPKDNNGRGESFSPTDLVASALISCMLTVMAIEAEKNDISVLGSYGEVIKEMQSDPRKIKRLPVKIHLPSSLSTEWRERLEKVAWECPVKRSINPDIEVVIAFSYDV